ncbi:helix-turn-helix domain-containing protein [Saccharopolyspora phatthalungensis]|uniref:Transcriptional regulator with XRE-family HTH domain n=1 Tax=Saccharopolyspora phatthalungensis TaxID=664693 RepID=A0A840Q3K1_9PSEU|nr:helix-turn-helix transcriptional regulator [Saccharopolyspora phatthalungensis]MBB5155094.1 transcriptional regulator with XRE-family HTH domain [Saccharopolyspora phatthalungensis]
MSNLPSLGDRIRQLRGSLYTQQQLADRAGLSLTLIRKLEQGQRQTCSVASLHKIAWALDVTLADLLVPASMPEHDQDQGITALRHAVSLVGTPKDEPATIQDAQYAEISAWRTYDSGQHDVIVRTLPQLIRSLESSLSVSNHRDRPIYAKALSQILLVAGHTLTLLRHPDAGHIATTRAVKLSEDLDDPFMAASAKSTLAWQLMVAGRFDESRELSMTTAKDVEPAATHTIPQLSLYGSLLLLTGNSNARAGNAGEAIHYLSEAREISLRVPDGSSAYNTNFGPSQISMQHTDIAINLGEFGDALAASKTMPGSASALPARDRYRHDIDRALLSLKTGDEDRSVALLSSVSTAAPVWFKNHRLPKSIVRDLLHTPAAKSEQLRGLATKLGVH